MQDARGNAVEAMQRNGGRMPAAQVSSQGASSPRWYALQSRLCFYPTWQTWLVRHQLELSCLTALTAPVAPHGDLPRQPLEDEASAQQRHTMLISKSSSKQLPRHKCRASLQAIPSLTWRLPCSCWLLVWEPSLASDSGPVDESSVHCPSWIGQMGEPAIQAGPGRPLAPAPPCAAALSPALPRPGSPGCTWPATGRGALAWTWAVCPGSCARQRTAPTWSSWRAWGAPF